MPHLWKQVLHHQDQLWVGEVRMSVLAKLANENLKKKHTQETESDEGTSVWCERAAERECQEEEV